MKRLILLGMMLLAPSGAVGVAWAAPCSGGADCHACTNCRNCAHCGRGGGTCSVCRPDLYQRASDSSPPRSPQTYSPPVYQQPRQAAPQAAPPAPRPQHLVKRRSVTRSITVPARWSGRVVGVADGDTLTVLYGQSPIRVRLYGVDAPEKAQPFGQASKQLTSRLAFGKDVTVYSKGADGYGRVLAWVFVGGTGLNRELVRSGLAWWYKQYSPRESGLQVLEAQARSALRGLWAQARRVAPWEWRRGRR